jgi:hypothetical protein
MKPRGSLHARQIGFSERPWWPIMLKCILPKPPRDFNAIYWPLRKWPPTILASQPAGRAYAMKKAGVFFAWRKLATAGMAGESLVPLATGGNPIAGWDIIALQ